MKIGIDIGGSHIAIGVIDENDNIIDKLETRLLANEKKDITSFIESYIIKNVNYFSEKYLITDIGIAVPGTVKGRKIVNSRNLGIENYDIIDRLENVIDLPIRMRNDAKCAAIAESRIGVLKDYNRSIFLTLGTGIGGAAIINGKLLDTGELPGCEFGHMIIQKDGIKCSCGNYGCFERYASMKALKTNLRNILNLNDETSGEILLEIIKNNLKDVKINQVINEFIEYLSIGISNLINIFEPEAVGIGGSFVYFSDILLEKLKNNIQTKQYLFNNRDELIILPATLGNNAGIIGSCK